jgi:creatinine amidohydrolase
VVTSESSLPSPWIQDLTWPEIARYLEGERTVLVPIGSTEQHGPAGPLGVDTLVAITLVEDVAERQGVLCAPPLWYGDSSHHGAFPGTISLSPDTLTLVVRDVCRSLARHGFDRIVLVNGHKGSNLPALTSAVRVLHEQELPEVIFAIADPLHLARSAAPGIKEVREHHAGELELSHVLFRFPGSLRMDELEDPDVDFDRIFGGFVGNDLFGPAPDGVDIVWSGAEQRRFAPTGSLSSSLAVSEEKGAAYHEHCVGRLSELIDWLRGYDGPIGNGGQA